MQGGAYAEHQITTVRQEGRAGSTAVDHPHFAVRLAPGAGARLVIGRAAVCQPADPQPSLGVAVTAGIIDTHVHVWCRGTGPECRPSSTARIPIPSESVPVEWLIDDMERTGISYAVLVQSSAFGANNRYIVECLDRFPEKFRGDRTGPPPRHPGSTPAQGVGVTRSVRVPVPSGLLRGRVLARCTVQRQDLGRCRRDELDTPVSPSATARRTGSPRSRLGIRTSG